MKKFAAMILALALIIGAVPAQAAGVADLFPATRTYAGFTDVPQGEWFTASVKLCYETGLLNGTGLGTTFSPDGTVTIAEAATLAARMHDILNGGSGLFLASSAGEKWYSSAIRYVENLGVGGIVNPEANATRQDFFLLLSAAVSDDLLAAKNSITALPDTTNPDVLAFYNAGILTGTDAYGTFSPNTTLTRKEMATMAARIVRPELRVSFVPQVRPAAGSDGSLAMLALGVAPDAYIATVNGVGIRADEFLFALCSDIYSTEEYIYGQTGALIDWAVDYGVGDLGVYFKNRALGSAIANELIRQQSTARGIKLTAEQENSIAAQIAGVITENGGEMELRETLAAYYGSTLEAFERILRAETLDDALFSAISRAELAAYAAEYDILRAKHILVENELMAEIFLEVIDATPTEVQFDELMNQYSEDPGLQSNPNGYLFTAGEFVPEFEAATRALPIGGHSGLVQSQHGYHIILRLDPADDRAGLMEYFRFDMLAEWQNAANIAPSSVLEGLNCEELYYTWLNLMGV